jgi:hypothetical protein
VQRTILRAKSITYTRARSVRNNIDLKQAVRNAQGNEFQQSVNLFKKEAKNSVEPLIGLYVKLEEAF